MFKTRLLSGIALVIIAFVTVYLGGPVWFLTVAGISLIGLWELYRAFAIHNRMTGYVGYAAAVAYFALLYFGKLEYVLPLMILFFFGLMGVYVFTFPKFTSEDVFPAFFGMFYVAVLMSHMYLTRTMEGGAWLVGLIFLSAWGCDTCAYCVGKLIGKHKMTPKLSPKKSIEGGIGGVVGAALLGLLYGSVFAGNLTEFAAPGISCAIICGVGGMISQVGDLSASAIKRNHNIKDYGTLIPGHGGIMDRFDSILFTAPIIYYLAQLLK